MAIRGGSYLVVREGIGMVVRLVGIVVTVRAIGPAGYGIYSGAAAYVLFVAAIAQMGTEVYLVRLRKNADRAQYNQAFTFLAFTSFVATAASLGLTYLFGAWIRPAGVLVPLRVLLLSIPINVLWAPGQAAIERDFRYRRMGVLELGGDIVLYATAIPLALTGAGAWALVAGFFAWQTWLLVGSLALSGLRPRWDWSGPEMRLLARHGITFSASSWIFRLGNLANPLIVGTFAGAAGVGFVSFSQRLVETLGFAQRGAFRLGLATMSRVESHETARLRSSLERGTLLQFLALVIPFATFGLAARWIVPDVFGAKWLDAVPVYTLLAVATVLNASGVIQTTFLFSRGQNLAVVGTAAVQTTTLFVASLVFVRLLGVVGWGVAALVALADLAYTDRRVRRLMRFSYRGVLPFVGMLLPVLFFPMVPTDWSPLLLLPILVGLAVPSVRSDARQTALLVRSSLRVGT